jgi:hypothetical protein
MALFRVPSGNENYLLVASCSADRKDIRMQPFQVQYSTSESTLEAGSSFPFPTSSLPHWVTQLNHFYVLFLPLVAHFPIMQHLPTCSPRSRNHHRCSCSDQSAAEFAPPTSWRDPRALHLVQSSFHHHPSSDEQSY